MKTIHVSNSSLEKLEKIQTLITGIFISAVIVMIAVGIFFTLKNGFSVFPMLQIVLLPFMVVNLNKLKLVRKSNDEKEKAGI